MAVKRASSPPPAPQQPAKRRYVRLEGDRPEMVMLLTRAFTEALGEAATKDVVAECVQQFKEIHHEDERELDVGRLAKDTLERLQKRGHTNDLHRAGRPQLVSDEDVDAFLDEFLLGNKKTGDDWWGWMSLRHGLKGSEELRRRFDNMKLKEDALWLRMKASYIERHGKKLTQISIKRRPKLSDATKASRIRLARVWLAWGFAKLCKVVWIDEKQEYLHPGGTYKCYAPPGVKSMQREAAVQLGKSQRIKYEAAVSAFGGAIYFTFVTGTTGRPQMFPVRTCIPAW